MTETSTELGQPITVVNPVTGEVLGLDRPNEDLVQLLADVREYEAMLREVKRIVQRELLVRLDRDGKWTLHLENGLKVSAPSPEPTEEFDELALRAALLELADEGVLTVEAVDRAIEPVVTYKAHKNGLNALRKLGGRVKAVIDAHASEVVKDRRITVGRR